MKRILCALLLGLLTWILIPATVLANFSISPGIVRVAIPSDKASTTISEVTIINQESVSVQYRVYAGHAQSPTQINPDYAPIDNLSWVSVSPEYVTIASQSTSTVTVMLETTDSIKESKQKFWLFVGQTSMGNINSMCAVKFLIDISPVGDAEVISDNTTVTSVTQSIGQTVSPTTTEYSEPPNRLEWWVYAGIIAFGVICVVGWTVLDIKNPCYKRSDDK